MIVMLTAFWNIWLELAPWLLLGAAAGGLLSVFVPQNLMQHHLSGRLGVLKAVIFGIPLPLCSCGVIPVGLGLKKSGASNGAAVGFLISTPQTGVDSILVSASFLGWPFAILKVAVALVTGLCGGTLADIVAPANDASTTPDQHHEGRRKNLLQQLLEHSVELIRSIWGWLLIGVFVSAVITLLVPENSLKEFAAFTGFSALLITLVVSLPLYVCATASVPVAAALVAGGLPPGAALVFLMAGPATNVATLGAVYRTLGGRVLVVYLTTIIAGSLIAGIAFNGLISPAVTHMHAHDHTAAWWRIGSGLILGALMLRFMLEDLRRRWRHSQSAEHSDAEQVIEIEGMTCDGCAARLQRELESHPTIEYADVSFDKRQAIVHGELSEQEIGDVVRKAGFEPKKMLVGPNDSV